MNGFFLNILNLSLTASIVAVAVMLLRLAMKKAPKWLSAALWAFVGVRLVFPFAIESRFSLVPSVDVLNIDKASSPEVFNGNIGAGTVNSAVNNTTAVTESAYSALNAFDVLSVIWLIGVVAFLLYGIISYLSVYLKVSTAIPLRGNIYQSENVGSPFVLGFVKPRVIVPFNLDEETLYNVILHENAHLRRKDHLVKPFAYLILCFHWFNPLMWLSYILLCRDIEVACDEKVIKNLSFDERKCYALALLNCKTRNATTAVCPVAFGEVSVKARIKNTLSYKKPAMWVMVTAIAVVLIASGCLLTNPKAETFYIEELPAVETTLPAENEEAKVTTKPSSEASLPATLPAETTNAQTLPPETQEATEQYEEYYTSYEEHDSEYTYEESEFVTVPDPFEEYMAQEEERILQLRYDALIADTYNHSDQCQCSNCDELRMAGIYPIVYIDTSKVENIMTVYEAENAEASVTFPALETTP